MNKYIKQLTESLFDDIDDIFNNEDDLDLSDELFTDEDRFNAIKNKLSELNIDFYIYDVTKTMDLHIHSQELLNTFVKLVTVLNYKFDIKHLKLHCYKNKLSFNNLYNCFENLNIIVIKECISDNLLGIPECKILKFINCNILSLNGINEDLTILIFKYDNINKNSNFVSDWSDLPCNLYKLKLEYPINDVLRSHTLHFKNFPLNAIDIENFYIIPELVGLYEKYLKRYIKKMFLEDNPTYDKKKVLNL